MAALIFDLDGTLVDNVYQHVLAWHGALAEHGFALSPWRIHRKIGMSGALLMQALELELGRKIQPDVAKQLEASHTERMSEMRASIALFDGVEDLMRRLRDNDVTYAIASSGSMDDIGPYVEWLGLDKRVPVLSQADAESTKPDPELFLKAAERLKVGAEDAIVIGDSVWDMLAARRAHFLGVGLLTGGYSESEMTAAGAYRVYADPAEFGRRLHEVGVNLREDE